MAEKKQVDYQGADANIRWDGRLCIHVQECGRSADELFVGGRDPWGMPDAETSETVVDVVERCPTGALTYTRKDGGGSEVADKENRIMVANNGPLYVRGDLKIAGAADDMAGTKFRAALCRCGQSQNKPFCDGAHEKAGFVDRGAVGEKGPGHNGNIGPLEVNSAPNGPLLVSGNFVILSSSGRVAWRGKKAALCRCGKSKNKPFCDGAHAKTGFQAP